MEDLCTACLCSGRKLHFIGETGSYHLYSQILTEIPVYEPSLCVRVCWECRERLRRFREFKALVKASYTRLLHHLHQPSEAPLALPPRLQVRSLAGYGFPEYLVAAVKQEQDDDVACVEDVEAELKPLKEESVHSEPDAQAFPATHRPKRKRTTKKTNKESTKKKVKSKTKKLEEKKINSKKKPENGRSSPEEFKVTDDAISDRDPDPGDTEDDMVLEEMRERKYRVVTKRKQTEADRVGEKRGEDEGGDKEGVQPAEGRKPNGVRSRDRSPLMVGEKPTCAECGKVFSSKKTYRYHLNVLHKGQNRYPCPRCGKVYQWKSNLGRHLRTHKARDSGELYCATCDKRFASVATYRQHLRVSRRHVPESEFSFTCQECGKKFVNKTRLRDHIDWDHLHKIKFRCQLCNKPFKCHTSLYVHLQNVHKNKEKENLCHICGKSYQNAAKLKYHIVAMHTSETPYRCAHCAAAFGWYSSLYRHVREVHYKMKLQPKRIRKAKRPETLPPPQPPPHM